ncbi:ABC transporter ATP-binding protein [Patescibacteria group bacterium]|nr:ABC transporter ATP-binding protein [Patescibacteria group bacterium]
MPSKNLIELKKICKTYHTGKISLTALNCINLTIKEGEFVAIMGPSGSGKSTLMNILGFLDVPSHGSYVFEGKKVKSFDEVSLADIRNKKVGFVFQSFYLLARMTALENVRLPLIYGDISDKEQVQKAENALKITGLGDRMEHNPNELSGGQQQRVAISRALVNEPKIIFADEPTGNLDSKSGKEIMEIFKKLNRDGNTIIMVTHDSKVASYAKRIIKLKDGEIISNKLNK